MPEVIFNKKTLNYIRDNNNKMYYWNTYEEAEAYLYANNIYECCEVYNRPFDVNLTLYDSVLKDNLVLKGTGYHTKQITKGTYGYISKIKEEVEELEDAEAQNNKLMILNELADIIGAIDGYLLKHQSFYSLEDLLIMMRATARAFNDGTRK